MGTETMTTVSAPPSEVAPPPASVAEPGKTKKVSLYVGDLDPEVKESDLAMAFSEYGPIGSVHLCRHRDSGQSLCYAFVNFLHPSHASKAMASLNHSKLKKKFMRVMWCQKDSLPMKTGLGNVFVKNLHPKISSAVLEGLFCIYGTILSCKVAEENGKSKGFGFVQYESEDAATHAIKSLHNSTVEGKILYVSRFVKKSERPAVSEGQKVASLYVKNLTQDIREDQLRDKFSEFGVVASVAIMKDSEGKSKGFGFVNFKSPKEAESAIAAFSGPELGTEKLYVGFVQKKAERENRLEEQRKFISNLKSRDSNLYVKNLDISVDDSQLQDGFSAYGHITSAKVMRDENGKSKGFGFVCFSTPEEAKKAVAGLNGAMFHGKQLVVAWAENKEERCRIMQNRFLQTISYPKHYNSTPKSFHQNIAPVPKSISRQPITCKHAKANNYMSGTPAAQYHDQYSSYIQLGPQKHKWDPNSSYYEHQSVEQAASCMHYSKPFYDISGIKTSVNLKMKSGNPMEAFVENAQSESASKMKGKELLNTLNSMAVRADPAIQVLQDANVWTGEGTGSALPQPASCLLY